MTISALAKTVGKIEGSSGSGRFADLERDWLEPWRQ